MKTSKIKSSVICIVLHLLTKFSCKMFYIIIRLCLSNAILYSVYQQLHGDPLASHNEFATWLHAPCHQHHYAWLMLPNGPLLDGQPVALVRSCHWWIISGTWRLYNLLPHWAAAPPSHYRQITHHRCREGWSDLQFFCCCNFRKWIHCCRLTIF